MFGKYFSTDWIIWKEKKQKFRRIDKFTIKRYGFNIEVESGNFNSGKTIGYIEHK